MEDIGYLSEANPRIRVSNPICSQHHLFGVCSYEVSFPIKQM